MVSNDSESQPDQQCAASTDAPVQHPHSKTWAGKASILLLLLFIAGLAMAAKPKSLPAAAGPSEKTHCMMVTPPHGFITTAEAHLHDVTGEIISAGVPGGLLEDPQPNFVAF